MKLIEKGIFMEKKTRYCPSCGNKTNDATCEICGRSTKPISMSTHERELDLIKDDIDIHQKHEFRGDQGHQESKATHHTRKKAPYLHLKAGEHPYESEAKTKRFTIPSDQQELIKAIPMLVSVVGIIVAFIIGLQSNDDEDSFENYTVLQGNFYDYISDEGTVAQVTCSLEKGQGVDYYRLDNPTTYFVSGEVSIDHQSFTYVSLMQPNSTLMIPTTSRAGQCQMEVDSSYDFAFHRPTIDYHIEEKENKIRYTFAKGTEIEDMKEVLKHSLAGYVQSSYTYDDIRIYEQEEQVYKVVLEVDEQIHVTMQPLDESRYTQRFSFGLNEE